MKKKLIILSSMGLSFMPMLALAQSANTTGGCTVAVANSGTIQAVLCRIGNILDIVIPIIIVLGVVYFIWGVVQYVISDDEEAKKAGKNRMIFGIIGLVVIVAMWGLVNMVTRTFGVGSGSIQSEQIPTVPF